MYTGVKKLRAVLVIGALSLSLYTPVSHAESGNVAFGLAAITGAASGMVVPAIMAGANVDVAQTNAATSVYLNSLSAATQAYAIGASTTQAMFNTLTTLRIASLNSQKELAQTYLTTAFQAWDRSLAYRLDRERLAADNYFRNRRLELEAISAQTQAQLELAKFNRELTAQGFSTGFKTVSNFANQSIPISPASIASVPTQSGGNLGTSVALRGLQTRPGFLAKAFREVASLAGGSSPVKKLKSDIGRFMELSEKKSLGAIRNSNLPLHRSQTSNGQDLTTHDGSVRAFRARPSAQ